jgi:hypothetical protein
MELLTRNKSFDIVLNEEVRTLDITFNNARTSQRDFNETVELIIRLGMQVGHDPRYDTIRLKSNSPRTFKLMSEYLVKKFAEFRRRRESLRKKLLQIPEVMEKDLVEVKCIFNEMEVMKFHFSPLSASFRW